MVIDAELPPRARLSPAACIRDSPPLSGTPHVHPVGLRRVGTAAPDLGPCQRRRGRTRLPHLRSWTVMPACSRRDDNARRRRSRPATMADSCTNSIVWPPRSTTRRPLRPQARLLARALRSDTLLASGTPPRPWRSASQTRCAAGARRRRPASPGSTKTVCRAFTRNQCRPVATRPETRARAGRRRTLRAAAASDVRNAT